MKYILLFLLVNVIYGAAPQSAQKVDLKIEITNIKRIEGTIELGIFNNSKSFLQKGKEYKTYSQQVCNDTVYFLLKDLSIDNYAISIYHDVNSDRECNLSFFGIPKEPYGFSKNYKPILSKPSFNDCIINVSKNIIIGIELLH